MNAANLETHDTVVIGAGQAGLSAAYHLARRGIEFVVLDANDRIGDQWRSRYDSLRLYSPAKYDSLPAMPFPLPGHAFPTGRQMADYLESYAARFELPVRTGVRVERLRAAGDGGGYVVEAGDRAFAAANVVIAAGNYHKPYAPAFASELDPSIRQMHSSDYRRPSQLADGPVLVVGLSHSGADLAMEALEHGHTTIVSGRSQGQLPFSVDSRTARVAWPVLKLVGGKLLTIRTPVGRKVRRRVRGHGGAPLLRYRRPELMEAGVELTDARTVGVRDGKPLLDDGRVVEVANVIWCTGFQPNFAWIDLPIIGEEGFPDERRGVVDSAPGIYFVGLPFQYAFTSMLVAGAGRDAGYVVARLDARARSVAGSAESPGAVRA